MNTVDISHEFPQLETERLILRKMTLDDTEALFKFWADDEVTKYMNVESFHSPKQAEAMILLLNELFTKNQAIRWGIFSKADNCIIGTCGYNNWIQDYASRGEIGYDLDRSYWGQGIMREALRAMINYGFEAMELNRIEALVVLDADRSMNVLQKLGFQMEGILREYGYWKGQFWDECCFSLLKKEWITE